LIADAILDKISQGIGSLNDLQDLEMISRNLYEMSNCGLGQTAGSPLRDILKHFRPEVEAHIIEKTCPAGVCAMSGQPVVV
jgi:NADP-reducing hydrogenase subunit HndC